MKRLETILFGLFILLAAAVQFFLFGSMNVWDTLRTLAFLGMGFGLLAALLRSGARKMSAWVWIFCGLAILAGLFIPPALLVDYRLADQLASPAAELVTILLYGLLFLAPISMAALLALAIKHFSGQVAEGPPISRPQALGALALAGLLLGKYLVNLYWLGVWDQTYDPLIYLWLAVPNLGALFAGALLASILEGRWKLAGPAWALVFPAVLILVFSQAMTVDFRRLTEERAGQVGQALEAYARSEGRYPPGLEQLAPRYLLSVPEPVILNGQAWCYQGGDGYYRLGYVDRRHWSDPNLFGHLAQAQGSPPALAELCAAEIGAIKK